MYKRQGNDTPVDGDTAITMTGGTVKSIYGGGSGENGTVGGTVRVLSLIHI